MTQSTFNVLVRHRAGHDSTAATSVATVIVPHLKQWNGAAVRAQTPGELAVLVQLGADDSLAAAAGGVGLIQAAYEQAGRKPAPLVPVSVEVTHVAQ